MTALDTCRLGAVAARLASIGAGLHDVGERVRTVGAGACDGSAWQGRSALAAGARRSDRQQDLNRFAGLVADVARSLAALAGAVERAGRDSAQAALTEGADAAAAARLHGSATALLLLARAPGALLAGGLVDPVDARVLAALGLLDRTGLPYVRVLAELRGLAAQGDPVAVRAYLDSLSPAQRDRLAHEAAALLGGLDGAPPRLRYTANRVVLEQALAAALAAGQTSRAGHLRELLADPRRQFLLVDPRGDGRVEEVFGDLDTARHVAVFVPGITHTLDDFDDPSSTREAARTLYDQAAALAQGSVATIAWLGYDTPGWADSPLLAKARPAAPALVRTVRGLLLRPGVTTTLVGHSYGSLVAAMAVRQGLQVDNLVLLGSPGVGVDTAADLHAPGTKVFAARAPGDLVAESQNFGTDPSDPRFGATRIATGAGPRGHSQYLTGTSESTRNLARVTVGDYGAISRQHDSIAESVARGPSALAGAAEGPAVAALPEPARRLVGLGDRLVDPDLYADTGTDLGRAAMDRLGHRLPRVLPW